MVKSIFPGERSLQIMHALKNNGPLSVRGIMGCVEPKITRRRAQDALLRLSKRGLINKRFDSLPNNAANFYQLSWKKEVLEVLAKLLNVDKESLIQTHFRSQELWHLEECSMWAHRLKKLFPNAKIIRDFNFFKHEEVKGILLQNDIQIDFIPDLLIICPQDEKQKDIYIAVEVERTRKSSKRIEEKLRKLTTQTHLDGVLYVSENKSILESIKHIYLTNVLPDALRIKHYGINFLMFSVDDVLQQKQNIQMFNPNNENVLLSDWFSFLSEIQFLYRRDENLNIQRKRADVGHELKF